jgi:hypothetical protein
MVAGRRPIPAVLPGQFAARRSGDVARLDTVRLGSPIVRRSAEPAKKARYCRLGGEGVVPIRVARRSEWTTGGRRGAAGETLALPSAKQAWGVRRRRL